MEEELKKKLPLSTFIKDGYIVNIDSFSILDGNLTYKETNPINDSYDNYSFKGKAKIRIKESKILTIEQVYNISGSFKTEDDEIKRFSNVSISIYPLN